MKSKLMLGSALALMLSGTSAFAAVVNLDTVAAAWDNVLPPGVTVDNTGPTVTMRWGTPAGGQPNQSGYDFEPVATPQNGVVSPFELGDFTHLNFPITGTVLATADLIVTVTGTIDGVGFSIAPRFTFSHDETPNVQDQCLGETPPCDDFVTLTNTQDMSAVVNVNGEDFTLVVSGFSTDGGTTTSTEFRTVEGLENTATLFASIQAPVTVPIPLPAAGWLLIGALGGLGALRRFRKA